MKNKFDHLNQLTFCQLIIFFPEWEIAQGMIFRDKWTKTILIFILDIHLVFIYRKFRDGFQWYLTDTRSCFQESALK